GVAPKCLLKKVRIPFGALDGTICIPSHIVRDNSRKIRRRAEEPRLKTSAAPKDSPAACR
ncbi:MAG: hypothetical protein ACKPKO_00345, partial [Candidatus Fonsibacter sp.]